jgi:cytochrome oxidase Cu insertion factor (SCO1/SenC/PrrC family)
MASTASPPVRRGAIGCLMLAGAASAALLPPQKSTVLPEHPVVDEQGAARDLRALAAGAPTLLLPIFSRCTGSCPVTAVFLRDALAGGPVPFRVIVFSFDARDQPRDLREFRRKFNLPREWMVVRSADAAAARSLLDALEFNLMTSGVGFDHPNETFVFSPGGRWAATLAGATFTVADLRTARGRALAADDPAPADRLGAWLILPEAWILLACAGLLLALIALAVGRNLHAAWARRRSPTQAGG